MYRKIFFTYLVEHENRKITLAAQQYFLLHS